MKQKASALGKKREQRDTHEKSPPSKISPRFNLPSAAHKDVSRKPIGTWVLISGQYADQMLLLPSDTETE